MQKYKINFIYCNFCLFVLLFARLSLFALSREDRLKPQAALLWGDKPLVVAVKY